MNEDFLVDGDETPLGDLGGVKVSTGSETKEKEEDSKEGFLTSKDGSLL